MKTVYSFLFFSFIILSLTSCTKESFDKKIVGKWQLTEIYQSIESSPVGWHSIPQEYQHSIEFLENGSFIKIETQGSTCTGTYSLSGENEIILTSSCTNSTDSHNNMNLGNKALTITYEVRGGEIKEKFTKVQ